MKEITSSIFEKSTLLDETDEEFTWLKDLIDDYPTNTFGILNKKLNSIGFMITVEELK